MREKNCYMLKLGLRLRLEFQFWAVSLLVALPSSSGHAYSDELFLASLFDMNERFFSENFAQYFLHLHFCESFFFRLVAVTISGLQSLTNCKIIRKDHHHHEHRHIISHRLLARFAEDYVGPLEIISNTTPKHSPHYIRNVKWLDPHFSGPFALAP